MGQVDVIPKAGLDAAVLQKKDEIDQHTVDKEGQLDQHTADKLADIATAVDAALDPQEQSSIPGVAVTERSRLKSDAAKIRGSAPGTALYDGTVLASGGLAQVGAAERQSVEGAAAAVRQEVADNAQAATTKAGEASTSAQTATDRAADAVAAQGAAEAARDGAQAAAQRWAVPGAASALRAALLGRVYDLALTVPVTGAVAPYVRRFGVDAAGSVQILIANAASGTPDLGNDPDVLRLVELYADRPGENEPAELEALAPGWGARARGDFEADPAALLVNGVVEIDVAAAPRAVPPAGLERAGRPAWIADGAVPSELYDLAVATVPDLAGLAPPDGWDGDLALTRIDIGADGGGSWLLLFADGGGNAFRLVSAARPASGVGLPVEDLSGDGWAGEVVTRFHAGDRARSVAGSVPVNVARASGSDTATGQTAKVAALRSEVDQIEGQVPSLAPGLGVDPFNAVLQVGGSYPAPAVEERVRWIKPGDLQVGPEGVYGLPTWQLKPGKTYGGRVYYLDEIGKAPGDVVSAANVVTTDPSKTFGIRVAGVNWDPAAGAYVIVGGALAGPTATPGATPTRVVAEGFVVPPGVEAVAVYPFVSGGSPTPVVVHWDDLAGGPTAPAPVRRPPDARLVAPETAGLVPATEETVNPSTMARLWGLYGAAATGTAVSPTVVAFSDSIWADAYGGPGVPELERVYGPRVCTGWVAAAVSQQSSTGGLSAFDAGWTERNEDTYDADGVVPVGLTFSAMRSATVGAAGTISGDGDRVVLQYQAQDGMGSFRWRVDGGAWSVADCDNNGALAAGRAVASGLAYGPHAVDVEVVSGEVAIGGAVFTRDASVPGLRVHHACNPGSALRHHVVLDADVWAAFAADLGPVHAVCVNLGINDVIDGRVAEGVAAAPQLVARVRQAFPGADLAAWALGGHNTKDSSAVRRTWRRLAVEEGFCVWDESLWVRDLGRAVAAGFKISLNNIHPTGPGLRALWRRFVDEVFPPPAP